MKKRKKHSETESIVFGPWTGRMATVPPRQLLPFALYYANRELRRGEKEPWDKEADLDRIFAAWPTWNIQASAGTFIIQRWHNKEQKRVECRVMNESTFPRIRRGIIAAKA